MQSVSTLNDSQAFSKHRWMLPHTLSSEWCVLTQLSLLSSVPFWRKFFVMGIRKKRRNSTLFMVKTFCHHIRKRVSLCFQIKDPVVLPQKLPHSLSALGLPGIKQHMPFVLPSVPKGWIVTEKRLCSQTFLLPLIVLQAASMLFLGNIDSFTE